MASVGKGSTNGGDGARSLGTSGKRTRGGPVAGWRRLSIAPGLEDPEGITFLPELPAGDRCRRFSLIRRREKGWRHFSCDLCGWSYTEEGTNRVWVLE
jgi:hypothetical protein